MKNLFSSFAVICTLLFITACQEPAPAPQDVYDPDITPEKNAVAQQGQRFVEALKKGDTNMIGSLYASDAKIMDYGSPSITGTENIVGHYVTLLQDSITDMRFNTLGVWGNQSVIIEEGTLEVSKTNGQVVDRGKYLVVWKKVDNEWKIFRDMYNSDGPIAGAPQ